MKKTPALTGEAVGLAAVCAPDHPTAEVLDVGVHGNKGVSVASGKMLGVATLNEAANDKGPVNVGARCKNSKDAGDNALNARAVKGGRIDGHLFRWV